MRTPQILLASVSVALFGACTPAPSPLLEVTPTSLTATAGDAAKVLEAKLTNSGQALSWTLSGPGSLSANSGNKVNYTPPTNLASDTNAVITVSAGALQKTIQVSLKAKVLPAPALTVTPAALEATAGDAAKPLEATLSNSTEVLSWTLSGPGSLSATTGSKVNYLPPTSLANDSNAVITVSAGALQKTIQVSLKAIPTVATLEILAPTANQTFVYNTNDVVFNAKLTGSGETVVWSLEGNEAEVGKIAPNQGTSTLYTPPLSGTADRNVTLKVKAGTLEKSVTFKLALPTLTVQGSTANIVGGSTRSFSASLNNRDNANAVSWTLEGVGSLNGGGKTFTGSSVTYTAPNANTVTTEQTIKLTATSGSVSKVLEFKLVPSVKLLTLTPSKTDLIAGEGPITISLLRTLIGSSAPVTFSVSPAGAGSIGVIDANTYSYTPPATVPTGTTATVTLSFTVDGVTQTQILNIKPKPALALDTPNKILTAGDAAITLTATRTDLDASKAITYTVTSITPAGAVGGTTITSSAPGNTATYTPPSSVTADTTVVITATTGSTPADATTTLTLTIKPKPVVP